MSVCDLSGCKRLTSHALEPLSISAYLRVLNIDRCVGIGNDGVCKIAVLHERLEGLSLMGLGNITDEGLLPVALACKSLHFVNLNNCNNITDITIEGKKTVMFSARFLMICSLC